MPTEQTSFKRVSKRANLLLQRMEGYDVDFKQNNEISSDDLVAFANSQGGGTILLGVKEATDSKGHQYGEIVGCRTGDPDRLKIVNKANDCVPPIKVRVIVENSRYTPFFRVEIPSGDHKPYCTKQGTYKTRDDGRNAALLPTFLLGMFVVAEGKKFADIYSSATERMQELLTSAIVETQQMTTNNLRTLERSVSKAVGQVQDAVEDTHLSLDSAVDGLEQSVEHVRSIAVDLQETLVEFHTQFDDAFSEINSVGDLLNPIESWHGELAGMLDAIRSDTWPSKLRSEAICAHLGIEDPWVAYWRSRIQKNIEVLLKEGTSSEESIAALAHTGCQCESELAEKLVKDRLQELRASGALKPSKKAATSVRRGQKSGGKVQRKLTSRK